MGHDNAYIIRAIGSVKSAMRHIKRWGPPKVIVKKPERYLHAHARRRLAADRAAAKP